MRNDFILYNEYSLVLEWLKDFVPLFFSSQEYSNLSDGDRDISGVVCSAFARYLVRLQVENTNNEINESIFTCYRFIENLAKSKDSNVIELLWYEIFESFECDQNCLEKIVKNMSSNTKDQWIKWNEKNK
jgi:hypothetical protein